VIKIRTRANFLFIFIVVVLTITTIIGFMRCEHKFQRAIELDSEMIEEIKEYDEIIIETENGKDGDANQAIKPVSLGEFKLTAYCSCVKCCGNWAYNRPNGIIYGAIWEELKEGYSIAVDPNVIPYRTEVIINGHTYKAQDCGGAIKGNRIDVYFNNHNDALEFGVQYAEVFLKNVK
jgi:3D (Asp-Asp-Asp) domain-containing protein